MDQLKRLVAPLGLGARIKTVIDVGVRKGTPDLYDLFPNKSFVLVDPQIGGADLLETAPKDYVFVNKGLSDAAGELTLNENRALSSFLDRTALTASGKPRPYQVPVTTLDDLIETHVPQGRIGLKIDTEGFEDRIMLGLNRHADRVDFVIAEASIRRRFEGSYTFSDLVVTMRDRGLMMFNILTDPIPKPRFYDALFLCRDHPCFA